VAAIEPIANSTARTPNRAHLEPRGRTLAPIKLPCLPGAVGERT
jgi:hypothetical protein